MTESLRHGKIYTSDYNKLQNHKTYRYLTEEPLYSELIVNVMCSFQLVARNTIQIAVIGNVYTEHSEGI